MNKKGRRENDLQKPQYPDPSNIQSAKKPGERAAPANP